MTANRPNIVFLDEYSMSGRDTSCFKNLGNYTGYHITTPEEVVARCADADIIIANKTIIDRDVISALPKLKLICIAATGMNNVDLSAAAERSIPVKNAAGYSTHAVAETTIGAVLALRRQVEYYDNFVKSGSYAASGRQFHAGRATYQLHGSNWGIIGLGNIGREVAKIATAMGCEVRYYSTSGVKREESYKQMPFDELIAWADIISIHAPLNEKTAGLIDGKALSKMKPSAILINVARGGIVDETALAEALNSGTIAGAGIDVFEQEPINADNPLTNINDPYRIILSPHNAWAYAEAIDVLISCIADNIKRFLECEYNGK